MSPTEVSALYRLHSAQCIDLAHRFSDSGSRLMLLHMARSWQALADQADKNSETTLVYETPEPRQHAAQQQQQPQSDKPDKN